MSRILYGLFFFKAMFEIFYSFVLKAVSKIYRRSFLKAMSKHLARFRWHLPRINFRKTFKQFVSNENIGTSGKAGSKRTSAWFRNERFSLREFVGNPLGFRYLIRFRIACCIFGPSSRPVNSHSTTHRRSFELPTSLRKESNTSKHVSV